MRHVQVYIGIERDRDGAQINPHTRAEALKTLRLNAAREFGGYTISNAVGGWTNPDGELVEEGSVRLDLYTDRGEVQVERWAREAGALFNQHTVLLDDAGRPRMVEVMQ